MLVNICAFHERDEKVERTPEDGGCADLLCEGVERERGDDRAGLAARGGHAVRGRAEARREDLGGVALFGVASVSIV